MHFDIYCDESYPDLFSSKNPQGRYMVLGSLWLETKYRERFKQAIHEIRDNHKMGKGEFKWKKVSRSRLEFYMDLLKWFIEQGDNLRFRCIVVESNKIDLVRFHNSDQELGFYKFYYQILHQWILDSNSYNIFCDYKTMSIKSRLNTLHKCLSNSNQLATINTVQAVHSNESVLLQLNDVLLGIASAKFNASVSSGSLKHQLVSCFEEQLGRPITPTNKAEQKFNVFKIDLQGGW